MASCSGLVWTLLIALATTGCGRVHFQRVPAVSEDGGPEDDAGTDAGPSLGTDAGRDGGTCLGRASFAGPTATVDLTGMLLFSEGHQHVLLIDMTGATELEMNTTICDVTGFPLNLGDSQSNDAGGGDAGHTSNDAEIVLEGTQLTVFANDLMPAMRVRDVPDFAAVSGCVTRRLIVADQRIASPEPPFEITGPELLRLNPPTDTEGVPDARWYLGINRTIGRAERSGSGVVSLDLCIR